MRFTFKTEHPTGRWRSFYKPNYTIKRNGAWIGEIENEPPHRIRLMVLKDDPNEDGNPNCSWKWITLKKEFVSVDEAKNFVNRNCDAIQEKFKVYENR